MTSPAISVLDNPAWHSLSGAHARFALGSGRALRYDPEVSVWGAVPDDATAADWEALAALVPIGEGIGLPGRTAPASWSGETGVGLQMTDDGFQSAPGDGDDVLALGAADVPEMIDLVERTKPGPFAPRTIELGGYAGIRVDGRLAAMAGRRMNPTGWVEVSAVCTDPEFRGRGFAARVVRAVVSGIRAEGQRAFLHVRADNDSAKGVYERLGFAVRREFTFSFAQPGGRDVAA
ncbi:MAG TPA: GNAT family N-acetyltransferase [Gryllotalpicola sp.]